MILTSPQFNLTLTLQVKLFCIITRLPVFISRNSCGISPFSNNVVKTYFLNNVKAHLYALTCSYTELTSNQPQRDSTFHRCFTTHVFLKVSENPQQIICAEVSFLIESQALGCSHIKTKTPKQAFSRKICKLFKTFFIEQL